MRTCLKRLTKPLHLCAWTFAALVLVYAAIGPHGALLHHPLASLGIALIGLGLLIEARRDLLAAPAVSPVQSARRLNKGADDARPRHNRRFDEYD